MAIVTTGQFPYPDYPAHGTNIAPAFNSLRLDSAGEQVAFIFPSPITGTLTGIVSRVNTVITGGDCEVRIEGVSTTTGNPDGTLVSANANTTITMSSSNVAFTATLTAGAALTQGQMVAVVFKWVSGDYNIATGFTRTNVNVYPALFTGTWAKQLQQPVLALNFGGTYARMPGLMGAPIFTTYSAYGSTSTPDERGVRFTLPVGMRTFGALIYGDLDGNADIILYDGSNNALATATQDSDIRGGVNAGTYMYVFPSSVTLSANTTYRLAVRPTSTNAVSLVYFEAVDTTHFQALPGGGAWVETNRTDAGSWTDGTIRVPGMSLLVDGIDAGGLIVHPGMSGGMRG